MTRAKPPAAPAGTDPESLRLEEDARRERNWKRWGPYLAERQWATVREDYSEHGTCWDYFPHDHARSRAYRWGEDGLLGFTDRECRLCFALALWNGKDPVLKERLFGLTGPEGNHGEDCKELYFYLDSTPTHSYVKSLYKYPQAEFPYARLVEENRRRGRDQREFEITDTGVFEGSRYFDVTAEYAKAGPDDILIRLTVANRGPEAAAIDVLPTLWFRNTWSWGCTHEGCGEERPRLAAAGEGRLAAIAAEHPTLGSFRLLVEPGPGGPPELIFTENETNAQRLFNTPNATPYVKDAFHERVVRGREDAVNPARTGTKAAAWHRLTVPAGGEVTLRLRLFALGQAPAQPMGAAFDRVLAERAREADEFYAARAALDELGPEEAGVARQAYAGLLTSKQFYHYIVEDWLEGDPAQPSPPAARLRGRNHDWKHLYNRDIISMPDKWEYPWYAAWDLAFHMIPMATVDPVFAKEQLLLFLREWYMHPNGQIPAYEFALSDVNPPVHAWACWRVYKKSGPRGRRDRAFLASAFQKLLLNFTWWVNRKDPAGHHVFAGGFLGLDNIGVFDRNMALPPGVSLEQADGTAWMAFYCVTMLAMAMELALEDPVYEDMASKFFEHFIAITDAMNTFGGTGLWDEEDGFYYDHVRAHGRAVPLKVRSLVGVMPLLAAEVIEDDVIHALPGFKKRAQWFVRHRADLARHISYMVHEDGEHGHRLLAVPSRERLGRVLRYLLDENEFLSPFGVRSVSRVHEGRPYVFKTDRYEAGVRYTPGESDTWLFGGNSNWRGPIWFPINFLIVEALERYHHFYGDHFKVECPVGSGRMVNLRQAADEIRARLTRLFLPGPDGRRPCFGDDEFLQRDPHMKGLLLFHEHFHGDSGRGLGASHQTGWTALVATLLRMPGGSLRQTGAAGATAAVKRRVEPAPAR